MDNALVRPWQPEDRLQLVDLWQKCFGDSQEYVNAYHRAFLTPGRCMVAEADGKVVSAMYIMNGPLLFPPSGKSLTTAYTYALATDPAYRRQGLGSAVYRACTRSSLDWADASCVLPAEQDLYPFYQKATGCTPVSYIREALIPRSELAGTTRPEAVSITAGEYYLRRKALLRGLPYAVMTPTLLSLESLHMRRFGGGMLDLDGDIAAVEMDGKTCRVLELLAPEGDWEDVMATLRELFPAEKYLVRTPLFFPGPGEERPFVLGSMAAENPVSLPRDLWWGFAFD